MFLSTVACFRSGYKGHNDFASSKEKHSSQRSIVVWNDKDNLEKKILPIKGRHSPLRREQNNIERTQILITHVASILFTRVCFNVAKITISSIKSF